MHIFIGFPPGGPTDIGARLIGQWLSERLGQPFIVENRPGGANNVATEAAAHAAPDGYTLLAAVGSNTINPAPLPTSSSTSFAILPWSAAFLVSPLVLEVIDQVPAKTVPELIAYAKANPGKITLASFGTGYRVPYAGEFFKMNAGIDMVHVPYRGSAPMVVDLIGGQVQTAFDNLPASMPYIKQGKLRPLGVVQPNALAGAARCADYGRLHARL